MKNPRENQKRKETEKTPDKRHGRKNLKLQGSLLGGAVQISCGRGRDITCCRRYTSFAHTKGKLYSTLLGWPKGWIYGSQPLFVFLFVISSVFSCLHYRFLDVSPFLLPFCYCFSFFVGGDVNYVKFFRSI